MATNGNPPKITWGASFAKTLNFGYPLDTPVSWTEPSEDSIVKYLASGIVDSWIVRHEAYLEAQVRWVPTTNTTSPVTASGWDSTDGWMDFLEWARAGNAFRFYPDKDQGTYYAAQLVEPMSGGIALEKTDGTRKFALKLRTSDGSRFTGY